MTEKDFSTIKKTLRALQNVQATANVRTFGFNYTHYEDTEGISVTVFRENGSEPHLFDFYGFQTPEKRLETYNSIINHINGQP